MFYDINKNIPLVSRAYPESILDKISVDDLLKFNNNHYIILLSSNLESINQQQKI